MGQFRSPNVAGDGGLGDVTMSAGKHFGFGVPNRFDKGISTDMCKGCHLIVPNRAIGQRGKVESRQIRSRACRCSSGGIAADAGKEQRDERGG